MIVIETSDFNPSNWQAEYNIEHSDNSTYVIDSLITNSTLFELQGITI